MLGLEELFGSIDVTNRMNTVTLILNYLHLQMYGRYTKDLGEFAKDEARKLKLLEKRRKQEDKQRNKVCIKMKLSAQWCLYYIYLINMQS